MPNDRIGATNLFLWQKLKSALMWCIYAFHYYLIIKLHRLVPSRTICRSSITPRDLECMLCDETADPIALPLSLLEEITYGFSNDQEIGRGGFAVVYKGKLEHRTVAVKRMSNTYMYEKEFHREVECLMIAKHKNVVRFLGYCADTQGSMEKYEGKFVMADVQQKLLCFEYLPKGSLHEYITDTSREPRWRDCYQIITGICQGLHYLHKNNIIHLDLKPANILLDDNLVAKIADFGLSRCFIGETGSQVISKIAGTHGYLAPESFNHRTQVTYRHSYRLDIYSLGVVIMEILTGEKDYHILDNVVERWSNKVEKSKSDIELKQVRVCAEIGIQFIDSNPAKRPNTQHIINRLDETKTMDGYSGTGAITSQHDKHPPYELHQDKPNAQGQASSEDKATIVTVADTNPYINLQWRYLHLNPDIRRCFEYCSIFPRGSKVRKGKLVSLWIAQGFVKTSFAGEDMEDVAESYIQELVSCSFLEPVKTCLGVGDLTDCFSFHTVVHDLLDKVVGNDCFRIENERSQRGEGWKGDVPRDVCHLFVQKYNSDLIIEKILALENLCTLIFDVVGKEAPVEKNVIESICKKLPKLRVLAFAFRHEHCSFVQPNNIFSVPESICQLKHLCYLAFRTSILCKVILPNTLNKLQHIRLLDFGRGQILEFSFPDLITLRHIICGPDMECPKDIGMLTSLQTIPKFTVRNGQGYEVKQLRDLNKLCGSLVIRCLDNIKSKEEALEANLAAKERLTDLNLQWKVRHNAKIQVEVLEGLCPPMGLKKLTIWRYIGWSYPDWMVGKQKGGPKDLQHLDFSECGQPRGPAPQIVEAFPHLHVLLLSSCHWDSLPGNMEHLTSLKYLDIMYCENIRSLPTLPHSLEKICLYHCNVEFMKTCETDGHPNWQKIKHIPEKKITYWSLMAGPTIDRRFQKAVKSIDHPTDLTHRKD